MSLMNYNYFVQSRIVDSHQLFLFYLLHYFGMQSLNNRLLLTLLCCGLFYTLKKLFKYILAKTFKYFVSLDALLWILLLQLEFRLIQGRLMIKINYYIWFVSWLQVANYLDFLLLLPLLVKFIQGVLKIDFRFLT